MNPYEIQRRDELLMKLKTGRLTPFEQQELQSILEKQKEEAERSNNGLALLGLILLLAALSDDSKKG